MPFTCSDPNGKVSRVISFTLRARQDAALRADAAQRGITVYEMVREIVAAHYAAAPQPQPAEGEAKGE